LIFGACGNQEAKMNAESRKKKSLNKTLQASAAMLVCAGCVWPARADYLGKVLYPLTGLPGVTGIVDAIGFDDTGQTVGGIGASAYLWPASDPPIDLKTFVAYSVSGIQLVLHCS
jgi:hypothetical protein